MTSTPLPSEKLRAFFPAFKEPSLRDKAFFENAGGSYACVQVIERLTHYYRALKVQPYGAFAASIAAGRAMDEAYENIARALNLDADWIHFGPSTSANTYVLAQAFGQILSPGETIIVTNQDHEANTGVWRRLAKLDIEVRQWAIDPENGQLDIAALQDLLDDTVRLVTFPHCSNIVGHINPVRDICKIVHQAGALAIVDGVSLAPHGLPDVRELDADIYFFSAYKTYGPHVGAMAIRPSLAASLPNQGHHFNENKPRYRLTPAGPDHAQIAAMGGIPDYLEEVGKLAGGAPGEQTLFDTARKAMKERETALMKPLLDWIGNKNSLRLIGPTRAEQRAPTIALELEEAGFDAAERLARHGIMAGGGHFYSQRTLEALGIEPEKGVLRLSFVHYTSENEINRLIAALDKEL